MRTHIQNAKRFEWVDPDGVAPTQKGHPQGVSIFKVHTDAVGILPGEEMAHAISTKSVISTDSTPSGKQVRECGARVIYADKFSLVLGVLWNISALPQYLERYAARYANPLRHTILCKFAYALQRKWVRGRAEHEQKETGTHFGVPVSFYW